MRIFVSVAVFIAAVGSLSTGARARRLSLRASLNARLTASISPTPWTGDCSEQTKSVCQGKTPCHWNNNNHKCYPNTPKPTTTPTNFQTSTPSTTPTNSPTSTPPTSTPSTTPTNSPTSTPSTGPPSWNYVEPAFQLTSPTERTCAADYGTPLGAPVCCNQAGTLESEAAVCPKHIPICKGYWVDHKWGYCSNALPTTGLALPSMSLNWFWHHYYTHPEFFDRCITTACQDTDDFKAMVLNASSLDSIFDTCVSDSEFCRDGWFQGAFNSWVMEHPKLTQWYKCFNMWLTEGPEPLSDAIAAGTCPTKLATEQLLKTLMLMKSGVNIVELFAEAMLLAMYISIIPISPSVLWDKMAAG